MPPINKIKITKFRPSLLGVNLKLAIDVYSINPSTIL